jgi:hypothetical protein
VIALALKRDFTKAVVDLSAQHRLLAKVCSADLLILRDA